MSGGFCKQNFAKFPYFFSAWIDYPDGAVNPGNNKRHIRLIKMVSNAVYLPGTHIIPSFLASYSFQRSYILSFTAGYDVPWPSDIAPAACLTGGVESCYIATGSLFAPVAQVDRATDF